MQTRPGDTSPQPSVGAVAAGKSLASQFREHALFLKYHAARRWLRRLRKRMNLALVWLGSLSGITASLYYLVLSREFDREHRSVLLGKLAFDRRLRRHGGSNALLRRNIHRLEKGLIMRDRRAVFALDYIQETLDLYQHALTFAADRGVGHNEVHWAHHVLQRYFEACSGSPLSLPAYQRFQVMPVPPPSAETETFPQGRRTPYAAAARGESGVSFDALFDLARRRRSVRWFQQRPVENDKLDKMVELARLAPSACNRLPYSFRIFTSDAMAQKGARLAGGTGGFAQQIPALIVVLGDLSSYSDEKDRHLIYIDASLAAMSLMMAAETLGLGTCPINWSDVSRREKAMYQFLGHTPEYWRPIMLIAVGYAEDDGEIPYSSKKDLDVIRSFDNAGV